MFSSRKFRVSCKYRDGILFWPLRDSNFELGGGGGGFGQERLGGRGKVRVVHPLSLSVDFTVTV